MTAAKPDTDMMDAIQRVPSLAMAPGLFARPPATSFPSLALLFGCLAPPLFGLQIDGTFGCVRRCRSPPPRAAAVCTISAPIIYPPTHLPLKTIHAGLSRARQWHSQTLVRAAQHGRTRHAYLAPRPLTLFKSTCLRLRLAKINIIPARAGSGRLISPVCRGGRCGERCAARFGRDH